MSKLQAEQTTVDGVNGWGVTDGANWFFYAYKERQAAEVMALGLDTARFRAVNVCHPRAFRLSDADAETIRHNLNGG